MQGVGWQHAPGQRYSPEEAQRAIRRLERLAILLDEAFVVPGTKYRVGIDPILGLIPGIGDTISALLSAYIVYEASRLGVPPRTLVLMIGNVLLDLLVGSIPLLGDLFDFALKANMRNLRLMGITPSARETIDMQP